MILSFQFCLTNSYLTCQKNLKYVLPALTVLLHVLKVSFIFFQILIPFILVTCTLRAAHVITRVPVRALFLLIFLMSDAMALVSSIQINVKRFMVVNNWACAVRLGKPVCFFFFSIFKVKICLCKLHT